MSSHQRAGFDKPGVIHQHYMDIINSIPDAVYWTDENCNLSGCNLHFLDLLGLKNPGDLKGTPYDLLRNHAHWPEGRIDTLKLDDMNVVFSGNAQYHVEEQFTLANKTLYFKINRVPMYDEQRRIIGLVVVLTNNTELKQAEEKLKRYESNKKVQTAETPIKNHRLPKVLMIEDNLIAQNVERALLTALNCQVDIADTGDKALQLFNPGKYDLVLMDIGLEDTSGYVVAKNLRNKEKDTAHHVPIIALTGYEAEVVKYDCGQYCMEGAITKPLTSQQAEQIIKHFIYNMDIEVSGLKSI
ncbi:response regulator [Legionella sp. km772]|uniref:response regulator n=1 Tax=Legionella sp. km772 TaxID=2498111 RepID=UPI000F8C8698|nr:response regulator [Legionella sp. km772]RUR12707.1 PAS domain-containing sensor histidine kinase [Legionella sp. km772]